MKTLSLNLALTILMSKITVFSTIIGFVVYSCSAWLIYALTGKDDYFDYLVSFFDWLIIFISTLITLLLSLTIAFKFSKNILYPLIALADATKKIANGELNSRAPLIDVKISEAKNLINDFNHMAEKLELASSEIKMWNAAIAHELRTPVTILQGRLQGLVDGVFNPDKQLFENLVKQTEGLARIIEDLRTLSLAESGVLTLWEDKIDLSKEIVTVVEMLSPTFRENKLVIMLQLEAVFIACDSVKVRQALLAILENKVRYTNPGVVKITCQLKMEHVVVTIEDEGPKVPEELIGDLFKPFHRGEKSRSREYGGSGLGLSVVKAIIIAHNGSVEYYPSKLGGAGFKIILPLIKKLP